MTPNNQEGSQLWRNVTSYSRSDKDRTPRTWKATFGAITLTVTRHIHYSPDQWIACTDRAFQDRQLRSSDIEFAKIEAVEMLEEWARAVLTDIEESRA